MVDGPIANIPRCQLRLSDLHLTKYRIKIPFTGSTRVVRKAWENSQVEEKWANSVWSKKCEAKKKVFIFYTIRSFL